MREIKFRTWEGWTKKKMKMLYSDECNNLEYFFAHHQRFENLMQYTGLKDKNGKEIYEGDVVECNNKGQKSRYKVKFEITEPYESRFGWDSIGWYKDEIEVIGNIYENNHLLDNK